MAAWWGAVCGVAGALLLASSVLLLPSFFMAAGMGAADQPIQHGWPEYVARILLFVVIMSVPFCLMWAGWRLIVDGARTAGWLALPAAQ